MSNPAPNTAKKSLCWLLPLAFVGGGCALGYQTLWIRLVVDLLGAQSNTFAKVTGAFFLGLALGSWLASKPLAAKPLGWLWIAAVESTVAILSLPILLLAPKGDWLHLTPILSTALQWSLPFLLVTPASTLMGMVLPLISHQLHSTGHLEKGTLAWIYAANTLGGVASIPAILLFWLPEYGMRGTGAILLLLSIVTALGYLLIHFSSPRPNPITRSTPQTETHFHDQAPFPTVLVILAFGSGFLTLALESVAQIQIRQIAVNSLFSSGGVLCTVLLALGTASLISPLILHFFPSTSRALIWACWGACASCLIQPVLFHAGHSGMETIPYEWDASTYSQALLFRSLQAVGIPIFFQGFVLPIALEWIRDLSRESGTPPALMIARFFMWNGIGGWLGTECARLILIPHAGLWFSSAWVAMGYLLIFFILQCHFRFIPFSFPRIAGFFLLVWFFPFVFHSRSLPSIQISSPDLLIDLQIGQEGVVAVVEPVPGDRRIVMNNTYTLGGSTAQFNQERQAHLPILLHGDVHTIATLGVATGSTLAGATLHPSIQRIDAIELSPLVADLAQKHFAPYNRDAFHHQNVRLILEDARWIMAQSKSTYDLVLGDLFLPWESGAGRLFTLEHFQNIHQALKPGGLFCQWLPMFQLTSDQFESILHTFQSVFPDTLLVRGDFYAELPILGLIGGLTPERIRWDLLSQQCSELRIRNQIQDPLVRHPEGIALLIVGTPAPTSNAVPPLNTLANGWLEFDAARNILGLKTPWFAGVPFASFIRHSQQLNRDFIPDSLRPMHESGQFFLTLEIAGAIQSKELATLQAQAPNRLPYVMRADPHAQWTSWPSAYFSPKPLTP